MLFWLCLASGLCLTTGCSSSSPYDDYKVVRKTDAGGKQLVVATEENAQLFCQTNVPWKKCWWKPPRNGVRQVLTLGGILKLRFDKKGWVIWWFFNCQRYLK